MQFNFASFGTRGAWLHKRARAKALAARLGVGLLTCLCLSAAMTTDGNAQSSPKPSMTGSAYPAHYRFAGQVIKLTYTIYTGNKMFASATVDQRRFQPDVPVCDTPPDETGATFTCEGTYTITAQDMVFESISNTPLFSYVTFTGQKGTKISGSAFAITRGEPDSNPPGLTLPQNIVVGTDAGVATAVVDYTVSAEDAEDGPFEPVRTEGPASGSAFPLGTTTVGYSATDPSGNATTGSFTVTVEDREKPELIIPGNISYDLTAGEADKVVTYTPTARDNADENPTVSCTPASGSTFAVGTTTVSCTASDRAGNTTDAQPFTVTINDPIVPVVTVPGDITQDAPADAAGKAVTYTATATDNADPAPAVTCAPASGSTFSIGATTVSCTAKDQSGNTSDPAAEFTVTIKDVTAPVLTVPDAVSINADDGQPDAVVTYDATATDNSGVEPALSCAPASGGKFAIGKTNVSCIATDGAGNVTTKAFDVTVIDNQAPVLALPADITTLAATDSNAATVPYTATATDNSGETPAVSCTKPSGDSFAVGTTQVDCNAKDTAGNTATGSFTVTVQDKQAPTLPKPADIAVDTDAGKPDAVVTYAPAADDAVDPAPKVTCDPASGGSFAVGTRTVSCTATDASDNVSEAQTFTVTVTDREAPVVTSPADITVNTDGGLPSAIVTYGNASASDNVDGILTPTLASGSLASGSAFPVGTTTVSFTATDAAGNTGTASFTVTVKDEEAPTFTAPADIKLAATTGLATRIVTYATPTATDNATASPSVSCLPASGSSFAFGDTMVTCTATDGAANTTTKSFKVSVTDEQGPTLTVPGDIVAEADTNARTAVVTYPAATATDIIDPKPTVDCTPASGSTFELGENVVDCLAQDASGNRTKGTFLITVVDKQAPKLALPADIIATAATDSDAATVSFTATATDNVDESPSVSCSPASGSSFKVGATKVDCSATDSGGNTGTGSFTVTVEDKQAPKLSLPADITVDAPTGQTGATVTYTATATDNANDSVAVSCAPASGSTFAVGATQVDCSAEDAAHNAATGSFKVTVLDKDAPVLTLPEDIRVNTDAGSATAVVTYAISASDLVDGAVTPVQTAGLASGAAFPVGTTIVAFKATDKAGNTATGSFTVIVDDNQPPVLTVPGDISVSTDAGKTTATVDYTVSATDLVDKNVIAQLTEGLASGSDFKVGTTKVTYTATDASSNSTTKSFTITVIDGQAPTVSVPANISVDTDAGKKTAKVDYSVTATDLVDGAVTPELVAGLASGSDFPVGITTVTWKATDEQGNASAETSFTVTVADHEAPVVSLPDDIATVTDDGKKTAKVDYTVTATDAVDGAVTPVLVAGLASGADFPVGLTTVTWKATDAHNNTSTAISFTVAVTDNQAPVVTVPGNITVNTDPGKATAKVDYSVSAIDLVDGSVDPVQVAGLASGSAFPAGVTTVTWKATDKQGNVSAEQSFTVTVIDNQAPVLGMPGNITASTDAGKKTAKVEYSVSATDLVDGTVDPQLVAGLASGSDFPIGVTTVTWNATDSQGNASAEASFTVTVSDGEPPAFSFVPANIAVTVDYGQTQGTASWSEPTATDNVPGVIVSQTAGPASGSSFALGTTKIAYEAQDAAGNTATAGFTVTVSVTPPGNVTFIIHSPAGGSFGFSSAEPALNVAVNSSGGHGSSGAIALAPGNYGFSFSVPAGFGIASAQCSDAGSTIDAGARSGTLKVASGVDVSCTISTSDSADKAVALIGSFLQNRADIIMNNQPDIERRIERLTGAYSGNGGISAFGMSIAGNQLPFGLQISADQTSFAYSLQRSQADDGAMQDGAGADPAAAPGDLRAGAGDLRAGTAGVNAGRLPLSAYRPTGQNPGASAGADAAFQHAFGPKPGTDASAGDSQASAGDAQASGGDPMSKRFDVWAEGTIGRFDSAGGDGSFGIAHTGADYLLTPNVLVGLGLQVDWVDQNGGAGATVSGIGYLVGPYATARLSDQLYLDARAGWGQSFNQIAPLGTFQDNFDGNRWLATAALIGKFDIDRWRITPEARVTMFEEKTDAYVDGLGVDVPSVDVRTGQFAFGPTISTTLDLDSGLQVTPFVELKGIWTFMQDNSATAATATPGLAETGLRGRAETGLDISAGNGMSVNASAFYDGLGSTSYSSWGGKLGINQKF